MEFYKLFFYRSGTLADFFAYVKQQLCPSRTKDINFLLL